MDAADIKVGLDVKVVGFKGVACYVSGYPERWEPEMCYETTDDGEVLVPSCYGEGDWVQQGPECGKVLIRMHGDDSTHEVSIDDVEPLDEDAFCHGCGQIGCFCDGRE